MAHTAMLLCVAHYLAESRQFSGTLIVIFQPAEEGEAGARAMIEDGLFEKFPCDAVFGLHNMPGLPEGDMYFCPGPGMASSDRVNITVRGVGGCGAMPHRACDPMPAVASIMLGLNSIVARKVDAQKSAVVPTYAQAGVAAPLILVLARLIQGFSAGGKVGASTTLLLEQAPSNRRGFYASWQFASQGLSALAGALTGVALSASLSSAQLESWGWRVPLVIGTAIVPVGWWLRRTMEEASRRTRRGRAQNTESAENAAFHGVARPSALCADRPRTDDRRHVGAFHHRVLSLNLRRACKRSVCLAGRRCCPAACRVRSCFSSRQSAVICRIVSGAIASRRPRASF